MGRDTILPSDYPRQLLESSIAFCVTPDCRVSGWAQAGSLRTKNIMSLIVRQIVSESTIQEAHQSQICTFEYRQSQQKLDRTLGGRIRGQFPRDQKEKGKLRTTTCKIFLTRHTLHARTHARTHAQDETKRDPASPPKLRCNPVAHPQ